MGGQLMSKGVNVENYAGIVEASGGDIIKLMKRQALRFSATFEEEPALSVDISKRPFVITTNTSVILAHSLVVATGADSRWPACRARTTSRAAASLRARRATASSSVARMSWW